MAAILRHVVRLAPAMLALSLCAASARADEITVDGKRYEDVLVRESASRYYVWLPVEGRTISVPKDRVQDTALTEDVTARSRLIQKWAEWQQKQKEGASVKVDEVARNSATEDMGGMDGLVQAATGEESATTSAPSNAKVPPLQEIVATYAQHQDRLLRFAHTFRIEKTWDTPRNSFRRKGSLFLEGQYAYDGTRFMEEYMSWSEPPSPCATEENPSIWRVLWDGTNHWQYGGRVKPIPEGPRVDLRVIPDARACPKFGPHFFRNPRYNFGFGGCQDRELGFLLHTPEDDARRVDEILTNNTDARVHPNAERLGDTECYVVDVGTSKGTLTVWFDPARQYNIPKAAWRYRPGSGEEDPEWRIRTWEEVYRVNDYMQVQELWAPKETTWERHIEYANGEEEERRYRFRRLTFAVNPDFEARKTFTLLGVVEDGTEVSQSACSGVDPNTGEHSDLVLRKYTWNNGKLTPAKDLPIPEWAQVSNVPVLTETP